MNARFTLAGGLDARIDALGARYDVTPAFLRRYLATRPAVREAVEAAQDDEDLFARLGPLTGTYVRFALTTTERGRALGRLVVGRVPPPRRFLDVGCAYGGFLRAFRAGGADVVGIEISPELAALAVANLSDGRGDVVTADVLAIEPARLGRFDFVACNDVAEHVADAQRLVWRVADLLAPGGFAYFEIPNRDALSFVARDGHFQLFGLTLLPRPLAARYLREAADRGYDEMGELHDEASYRAWFAAAGLSAVDVPQPHAQLFETVHDRVFDVVNAFTWWRGHEGTGLSRDVGEAIVERYYGYTAVLFPQLARALAGEGAEAFARRYLCPFWTFLLRRG